MDGERYYFLVKFCKLDDAGVNALEDMLSERIANRKVDWGRFSSCVMLYEADREGRSVTLLLFDLPQKKNAVSESELRDYILEGFCGLFEVEVSKLSAEELARANPEAERKVSAHFAAARRMRFDYVSAAMTLKSAEQLQEEASQVCGWSGFSGTLARIARRMDNDVSGRTNLNVAFVAEANNSVGDYVRLLYDFYFARGAISVPYIYRGDLEDAALSLGCGAMYVVCGGFGVDTDRAVFGRHDDNEAFLRTLRSSHNVLVADLTKEAYEAVAGNPLFECLFPTVIRLEEPSAEEKLEFIKREAAAYKFNVSPGVAPELLKGTDVEELRAKLVKAVSARLEEEECDYTLSASDFSKIADPDEEMSPLAELDALIGLESVKRTVREITAFVEKRGKESGLCMHMVFRGRPGTGKTTVARIIGKIFGSCGVIKNADRFVEADRNRLVSKYLGGTASRTADTVMAALGGVLFIDEAYALCGDGEHDYGHEAVAALVKLMEDCRKDFVCILAGYPDEMDKMLDMNPGMRGRVQFYIDFPDYSVPEMMEIFGSMCRAEGYVLSGGAEAALEKFFDGLSREDDFANGRTVRRVFEQIRIKQAVRSEFMDIEEEDVLAVKEAMPLRCVHQRSRAIGFLDVA